MKIKDLEQIIITSFTTLNSDVLHQLNPNALYSGLDKDQIIEEIEKEIIKIKASGLHELKSEVTSCFFCYPTANAFNFLDKNTDEFVLRYVVHQESISRFKVEECKNRSIPSREDGLPF